MTELPGGLPSRDPALSPEERQLDQTAPAAAPADSTPAPASAPASAPGGPGRGWVLALIALGVVVALAVLVGVTGLGGSRHPAVVPRSEVGAGGATTLAARRDADINAAMARMNTALRQRDEAGYVSVVLPGRTTFLAHERAVFHALTRVPFADVHYWWWHDQFMPEPGLERTYHAPAFVAHVIRSYALTGWDPKPVAEPMGLTFVQQPGSGHWYLAGDTDGDATLPDGAFSEPWTTGDVSVARTSHVLVVGDPGAAAKTRKLAARIERLLGDVSQMWPMPEWNGKAVVYTVSDPRFVKAWFGSHAATGRRTASTEPATFDAVVGEVSTDSSDGYSFGSRAGSRMVLTPALQRDTDTTYVDQVLRHELTHMVTDNLPGVPPTWLVEGAAEYTASRVSPHGRVDGVASLQERGLTQAQWRQLRNGTFHLVLRAQGADFYAGTNGQVSDAYTSAWFACLYIADHYGEATLRRLYDQAADDAVGSPLTAAETESLTAVLHTTRAKLIRASSSYARALRRHFV